jgi:siroheme synthase (precorrin-2 oxidase/ferrochelatase)
MELAVFEAVLIAVVSFMALGATRFIQRSIRRELKEVIKETINPELERINQRIDDHMDREEAEMRKLIKVLANLSGESVDDLDREING